MKNFSKSDKIFLQGSIFYKAELIDDAQTLLKGFDLTLNPMPSKEEIHNYCVDCYSKNSITNRVYHLRRAKVEVADNRDYYVDLYPFEISEWLVCLHEWLFMVCSKLGRPPHDVWQYYTTFRGNYDSTLPLFPELIRQVYYFEKILLVRETYKRYTTRECKVPYGNTLKHHIERLGTRSPLNNGMSSDKLKCPSSMLDE